MKNIIGRRTLIGGAAALASAGTIAGSRARAQAATTIKIGMLGDMSGVYRDISGPMSVACTNAAIQDSGLAARGFKVEVLVGDHQNKPDVGSSVVRQWIDRDGVDMIVDAPNSGVSLAISQIIRDKDKIFISTGAATSDLTGKACSPNTIHWVYDTWMLAKSTGGALVKNGGDSWFFITADYAFGHALEADTGNFVKAQGGKVMGAVRVPLATPDFSSYLLQAQASKAKIVGLCNAGGDTINSIKQAAEFGLGAAGVRVAGLLVFISDVHALGLKIAQGLVLSNTFYWDLNEGTRKFAKKVNAVVKDAQPGMSHAGVYSGTLHYLKTIGEMGGDAGKKSGRDTVARMRAKPAEDDAFGTTTIREDGRALHPVYLFQVKSPTESKGAWDYYKLLATTPANEGFRPINEGGCSLVKA